MSTQYFSSSGGPVVVSTKKSASTRYAELLFLYPVGFVGDVVHSGAFAARNADVVFFMRGWDRYRSHKKRALTRYAKLEFLHPLGSVGHVVHSVVSGTQNIVALFFVLGWDRYGF
jgi:hypothetical protein